MNFIEEPARQTPIVAQAAVVVVGGGIASLSAAVASAKNGAQTLLVEAQNVLGGTILGGSSVLNSFTNNPKLHPQNKRIQLVRGFGQEIINRMSAAGGCPGFAPGLTLEDPEAPRQVIMLPEVGKRVWFEIIRDYNIELMTRTSKPSRFTASGDAAPSKAKFSLTLRATAIWPPARAAGSAELGAVVSQWR